jgi:acyl carrier protein
MARVRAMECTLKEAGMWTLEQEIRQIAAEELDIPGHRITRSASFCDLGASSCDIVGLLIALEDRFEIEFPFEKVDQLTSLARIAALIASLPKPAAA